jgi:ribonucleoside-diphosphate reductase beta chain
MAYSPGLCFANDLTSYYEALHCDFACVLYPTAYSIPLALAIHVRDIVDSAIQFKEHFIHEAISSNLMGMNAAIPHG